MNANTFAGLIGGTLRNQIPALAVATTTETIISVNTDTGTGPAVLSIPLQNAVLGSGTPHGVNSNPAILVKPRGILNSVGYGTDAPYFNSSSFDGRAVRLRAVGTFTSGVAANDLKIGLYLGSSATVGSNTSIYQGITTGTAGAFGAVSGHFLIETELLWDSISGKVDGTVNGFIAPSAVAPLPTTGNSPVYLTQFAAAAAANLQFVLSGKWNAANAGNTLQVTEFSLEMV